MGTTLGARTVTIDPCHTCLPLGAVYMILGIQGGVSLMHGSQGCCSFVRYLLTRHFREPVRVASTSFHKDAAVFGGRRNLIEGIRNLVNRYRPRFIGVISSCISETIGDDIDAFVREAKDELGDEEVKIVPIHTPSYAGSHIKGYDTASQTVLKHLGQPRKNLNGKLNIISGIINPGDVEEIKRILRVMGVSFTMISDVAETLDTPLERSAVSTSVGGTTVEELSDATNAIGTIALTPHAGGAGAAYLHSRFNIPAIYGPLPVGVGNTDRFLAGVKRLAGVEVPLSLERERGILLDAMADSTPYTMMKRVAITGDPDIVAAISRFICELEMEPTVVMSNTPSKKFAHEVEATGKEYGYTPTVISGGDLYQFEMAVRERGADVILGPTYGAEVAKNIGIPLVRIGFPVYDRFGYHRWPVLGYRGSLRLLDLIVNSILDCQSKH
ncbi:nitrogenase component 1 [Calderihabitans maritimus]|nr:nitrogenase component 1 [Calderihabitans maritimus]